MTKQVISPNLPHTFPYEWTWVCLLFTLSIGIAFLNPLLAKLLWIAILVVRLRSIALIRSRHERP